MRFAILGLFALLSINTHLLAADNKVADKEITLVKKEQGVRVMIGDELFTNYIPKSGTKPILWPLNGPGNLPMTRYWPMTEEKEEEGYVKDHPHHRSLWFSHGRVNNIDFWAEPGKDGKGKQGVIEHKEFKELTSSKDGKPARIVTTNVWNTHDGKPVLTDERDITFGANDEIRWIDFKITLIASEGDVTFQDTKEGAFALRVPPSMIVKDDGHAGKGHIVNSEGKTDNDTWSKRANWVDYYGPVGEKGTLMGIAIFDHPSSLRHPTRWHVRTYGLFAANPFGEDELNTKPVKPPKAGDHKIAKGDKTILRYRVILHKGNAKDAKIADLYSKYAEEK
jgi:hypothetical protein